MAGDVERRTRGARSLWTVVVSALVGVSLVVLPAQPAAAVLVTKRTSVAADGAQLAGSSHTPALSANGRYVAFITTAAGAAIDTNGLADVYRKDTWSGRLDLVSVAAGGAAAGNGSSDAEEVAISDDGTKVIFRSDASDLVRDDTNGQTDLFVRDLAAGTTQRVNVSSDETTTAFGPDFFGASADGNKIAFVSYTSLDGNPSHAVYVRNVAEGVTTFIHQAAGAQIAISGDGTKVAFEWSAPGARELYLYDENDPVLYRFNYGPSKDYSATAGLLGPDAMSYDGNVIAYFSDGDDWGTTEPKPRAVYAYNHAARLSDAPFEEQVQRVSETSTGVNADRDSGGITNDWPKGAVSADGNLVAFTSQASNLDSNAPSGGAMVKNRATKAIVARSIGTDGTAKAVSNTTLSSDGLVVGFATGATDLVSSDTNAASDVFTNADDAIVGIDLSLTVDKSSVIVSPPQVPFADIPVDPYSPAVESSGISLVNINSSPIGLVNINSSGIGLVNINSSPIGLVNINSSGIGLENINSSPLIRDALASITLAQLPLRDPLTWEGVLGFPVQTQSTTLWDVITLDPRPAGLANLYFPGSLADPGSTPLGGISVFSILLGQTPLGSFSLEPNTPTWCQRIEALGYPSCGAALDDVNATTPLATNRSLLELQLAGVPFDREGVQSLPVHLSTMGGLQIPADAPLMTSKLAHLQGIQAGFANIAASQMGAILLADLVNRDAVVDCSNTLIDCTSTSTSTLADADAAGAIKQTATFADLGDATDHLVVAQVIHAMLPSSGNPLLNATAEQLGILDYNGAGSTLLNYTLRFRADRALVNGHFEVDVPEDSLLIRLDSAQFTNGNSEQRAMEVTATGHTARFVLPEGESVAAGDEVVITFEGRPGLQLGTFAMAVRAVGDGLLREIDHAAPVTVFPVGGDPSGEFMMEKAVSSTAHPAISPGILYSEHVSGSAADFKQIYLEAGQQVDITVSDLSIDLDAVLYSPVGTAATPLRPPATGGDEVHPVPDEPASLSSSGEPLTAEIRDDIEFEDLPVAAIGANRGTASERLQALAPVAGWYTIQVAPYLDAQTSHHYLLAATVHDGPVLPACSARTFPYDADPHAGTDESATTATALIDGSTAASVPAATKTLILVNQDRIHDRFGPTAVTDTMAALRALRDDVGTSTDPGTKARVQAEIISVDASTDVRTAYSQWDTAVGVCSPEAANNVVRAINAAVDSVRGAAELQHLVIVGDDEMLPLARIPDLTVDDNERGYAGDLASLGANNALRAAYANGYLPTDDGYGDFAPTPYAGRYLYISDVGVGRLVETPTDWIAAVQRFVDFDGKLAPSTALTTGYDFMADTGQEIDAVVEGQLGTAQPDLLTDTWTKTDLKSSFTDRVDGSGNPLPAPDLVTLNGHFDHRRSLPANGTDGLFEVADIDGGASLSGRLIHSIGCHSGVSVADVLIGASPGTATDARDWAQAIGEKGAAAFVGQTGYGLGIDGLVALSERVLADYARNLALEPSVGLALTKAKQDYAGELGVFGVYDEKALVEATFFGLPMFEIGGVTPVAKAPQQGTGVTSFSGTLTASLPGISSDEMTIDNPTISTIDLNGRTALTIDGQAVMVEDRPIMPKLTVPVPDGTTGLLLTELTSSDATTPYQAAFADAVSDLGSRSLTRTSGDIVFPAAPHALTATNAVIVPSQFRVTDPNTGSGIRRDYTHMKYEALQPDDPVTCTDRRRPVIHSAEGTTVIDAVFGNEAAFRVHATDEHSDIVHVLVNVLDQTGTWQFEPLVQTSPGMWTGSVPIKGENAQFGVQVVDACGNVAISFDKGEFFDLVVPEPEPVEFAVDVTGELTAGSTAWYKSATVAVSGPEGAAFLVTVDGGEPFVYSGPVHVPSTEGVHKITVTSQAGDTHTAEVPIDNHAPKITIVSPADNGTYQVGEVVDANYFCADGGSGVASCAGTVDPGQPIDTSASTTSKAFTVTSSDIAGNSDSALVTYTTRFGFEGFDAPISEQHFNHAKSGSMIPMKWKLYSASGEINDLSVVKVLQSRRITCPNAITLVEISLIELGTEGLKYTDRYHYNWKTDSAWVDQCRTFEVLLSDGSTHTAQFKFF